MADKFVTLPEIRKHAKKILPRDVWNFGDGGAESETTVRRNRRAVDRLAIRQDILVDVREIDLRTSLLGMPLSWPVAIAPMGGLVLFHPEGDREMARGAAQGDTLQFLSGASGWSVEDVAKASPGPKMFQLYHHGDRTWAADLLSRVEASGYKSVVLTVDVQVYSRRERDIVHRYSPRESMKSAPNPRGPDPNYPERLTWDDVAWLKKTTRLPIGLKGIMTARDAKRAVESGVEIIWVSNHGGRQLDHTQGSIAALPPIVVRWRAAPPSSWTAASPAAPRCSRASPSAPPWSRWDAPSCGGWPRTAPPGSPAPSTSCAASFGPPWPSRARPASRTSTAISSSASTDA
jgi:L-lactate dehydrogenase (FMN-dependent) and related alpha-hydroxy acid dehydrogenases